MPDGTKKPLISMFPICRITAFCLSALRSLFQTPAFEGNNGNLGFMPVAFLAGKVIEATRSCIYKQGEIVAGRAGQGFCKQDHKVLYYK
jgi:hypothetical protein